MANCFYHTGRDLIRDGKVQLLKGRIRAVLIRTDVYTPDVTNDVVFSDLPPEALVAVGEIEGKKLTPHQSGLLTFTAKPTVFQGVNGDRVDAIVLFDDTGDKDTSGLLAVMDTMAGMPVTPNGGDITIHWSDLPTGIFTASGKGQIRDDADSNLKPQDLIEPEVEPDWLLEGNLPSE